MSDLADSLQGNYKHILKKTKGNHSLRSEGKSSISGWQSLRTYFLVKLMRNMKGQTLKEIMLNEKCQTKLSTCYNRKCKHYIEKVRWVVAWLCRGVVEEGCWNFWGWLMCKFFLWWWSFHKLYIYIKVYSLNIDSVFLFFFLLNCSFYLFFFQMQSLILIILLVFEI